MTAQPASSQPALSQTQPSRICLPDTRTPQRVVYFGTPQIAVPPLEALCAAGHDVVLVVTRPPKRRGRRQAPTPSPVEDAATKQGLLVSYDLDAALDVSADIAVVVAYGELIPLSALQKRRTVNLHFSLLPRWRGAAPVERAILAGDTETGVCLMEVVPQLDAGAIHRQRSTEINAVESADDLRARLCDLGTDLLLEALRDGFDNPIPQTGEVTWADKITSGELRIDWTASAEHVLRLVRVGGAWTMFRGRRLKVLAAEIVAAETFAVEGRAAGSVTVAVVSTGGSAEVRVETGCGTLRLLSVQSEGRSVTPALNWVNGARLVVGERFDS